MTVAVLSQVLGHAFRRKEMRIGPYTDACQLLRSIERDDHKLRTALYEAQEAVDSLKSLIDSAMELTPEPARPGPVRGEKIAEDFGVHPMSVITDMDHPLYGEAVYTAPQIHELATKLMERAMPGFEQAAEERIKFRSRYAALREAMEKMRDIDNPISKEGQAEAYSVMASKLKDALDSDDAEIAKAEAE